MPPDNVPHTVLVADDEAEVRSLIVEYLTAEGFDVAEAANGLEALLAVKRRRPRTVILDLGMPRLGGIETLKSIRAFDPTVTVVIITGGTDPELYRQAEALGSAAVLRKPLVLPDLMRVLRPGDPAAEPAPLERSAATGDTHRESSSGAPATPAVSILIVDDDEEIRSVLEELLALKGYETFSAPTATDALRELVHRAPDVILLDIEMPGLNGLDALPAIKAVAPDAAVIMVSGTSDLDVARQTLARGACDYVVKPIDVVYLVRAVQAAIAMTGAERNSAPPEE